MIRLRSKNTSGFTLVELLVVMGIFALLTTITLAGVRFARSISRVNKAKADIEQIRKAISSLATDTEEWPGNQIPDEVCNCSNNEIEDLTDPSAGILATDGSYNNWKGPYMPSIPPDPWGNNYFFDTDYEIDGTPYVVVGSYGPNGVGNNLYDSDDIIRVIAP